MPAGMTMQREEARQGKCIFAVDPGPEKSAYVVWDREQVRGHNILDNYAMRDLISKYKKACVIDVFAVEMIASYGMAVGRETFETCLWIGRFLECLKDDTAYTLCYRRDIKLHLCGSARAKDTNVWAALTDRFGQPGTKKSPGLLYGVKSHERAALAVAVYAYDTIYGGVNG